MRAASWSLTMLVPLLWVYFRAASWADSWIILRTTFTDFSLRMLVPFVTAPWAGKLIIFLAVAQLVVEFSGEDVAPFIYFQF